MKLPDRAFYEFLGGTDQDTAALAWFSSARPEQMGTLVARFRGTVKAAAWVRAALLAAAFSGLVLAMFFVFGDGGVSLTNVVATVVPVFGGITVIMGSVILAARGYRHDVCRHGLVLSAPRFVPRAGIGPGPAVVPWATIDPGRIFIGTTGRSLTRMPVALYRQRSVFAPAVMINGWAEHPRGRDEVVEQFTGGHTYRPMPITSPFAWWQIGVPDERAFLSAVEAAMVDDGYPAAGLTSYAMGRSVNARDMSRDPSLQQERELSDPVIGVPR